jgi:succinoglycan biosynthesis transport protein ExoP
MNETQYANYQVETGLSDVVRALWRRKWIILIVTAIFLIAAYFLTQRMPKQYQADAQMILIQRSEGGSIGAPDAIYNAPAPVTVATLIGLLRTNELANRTLKLLVAQGYTQDHLTDIGAPSSLGSVSPTNPTDSELINLTVPASDPDTAKLLTNAVVQAFVQWRKEEQRKDVQTTEVTLIAQTKAARRQMEITRAKQLAYQKSHAMLDSQSEARGAIAQLQTREMDISNIQQELDGQQAAANALAAQLKATNQSIQTAGPRDDSLTANLNSQLSQLEIQRSEMALRVTPAYPGQLPLLDKKITDIQERLKKAIDATRGSNIPSLAAQGLLQQSYLQAQTQMAATQARLTEAVALKNQITQKMSPLVQTGSVLDQLTQQAQEAAVYYSGLQSALVSARLKENQINGDVQITQAAVIENSGSPVKPSLPTNMVMGALLGLLVSLALVFVVEQTDRRMRTEDQVERLGSGPILGALPRLSRSALALLDQKQLPIPVAESYSLAGANLLRVLGSPPPGHGQIVMVTSAQAGEGKSLTAAELARSLARSGKQVILVDADMRQPALNTLFDNAGEIGLVEVLSGKALLDDALTNSETPNLSVLFNNTPRANSADIIVSPHMTHFLQMIRSRADIIVVDTPSCTVVDPLLLAPSVDYVLQVIDLGRANEDAVNSTSSVLCGLAPLGLFINRTNKQNAPAYEVARSFAVTQMQPGLNGSDQSGQFARNRTLMTFRNTPGYTSNHLNGTANALEDNDSNSHDLSLPINTREDH